MALKLGDRPKLSDKLLVKDNLVLVDELRRHRVPDSDIKQAVYLTAGEFEKLSYIATSVIIFSEGDFRTLTLGFSRIPFGFDKVPLGYNEDLHPEIYAVDLSFGVGPDLLKGRPIVMDPIREDAVARTIDILLRGWRGWYIPEYVIGRNRFTTSGRSDSLAEVVPFDARISYEESVKELCLECCVKRTDNTIGQTCFPVRYRDRDAIERLLV